MEATPPMIPYFQQLALAASANNYPLLQAFKDAGLKTSVFYRARRGGDLHLTTAAKVMLVFNGLSVDQTPASQA